MDAATHTHVLITGSNRGIGKALAASFLARPNMTVIASSRDPTSASSRDLLDLRRGVNSQIILSKIDNAVNGSAISAVEKLRSEEGITKIDIVIANAGISAYFGKASETPAEQMMEHFAVNTVGSLGLFQATAALLRASTSPKFVAITSGAGSIGGMEMLKDIQNTAYGASKCALNFVVKKIHFENPGLIAFCVNPGWLQTDLGNHAAASSGAEQAPTPVETGVRGIVKRVDTATREGTSGCFFNFDGETIPW